MIDEIAKRIADQAIRSLQNAARLRKDRTIIRDGLEVIVKILLRGIEHEAQENQKESNQREATNA